MERISRTPNCNSFLDVAPRDEEPKVWGGSQEISRIMRYDYVGMPKSSQGDCSWRRLLSCVVGHYS
jgi:hypothetical protein